FLSSLVFNADITGWNTSKVTNMIAMFRSATNFSQNLGSWDISKVNGMDVMFESSGMSADKNYTKTLVGWSKLSTVPSGITLGANNVTYCTNYSADADNARDFLINDKGWNITGDTVSNSCN
ncbi:MAG: BspA family leucine-rich repeat surface protein, partial [Tenacibaculum sp.]